MKSLIEFISEAYSSHKDNDGVKYFEQVMSGPCFGKVDQKLISYMEKFLKANKIEYSAEYNVIVSNLDDFKEFKIPGFDEFEEDDMLEEECDTSYLDKVSDNVYAGINDSKILFVSANDYKLCFEPKNSTR